MNPSTAAYLTGLRFEHKYWLDGEGKPMVYVVTKVADGVIYIKPVGARKAKEFCTLARWPQVFGKVAA